MNIPLYTEACNKLAEAKQRLGNIKTELVENKKDKDVVAELNKQKAELEQYVQRQELIFMYWNLGNSINVWREDLKRLGDNRDVQEASSYTCLGDQIRSYAEIVDTIIAETDQEIIKEVTDLFAETRNNGI